jgi:hypothetical protein
MINDLGRCIAGNHDDRVDSVPASETTQTTNRRAHWRSLPSVSICQRDLRFAGEQGRSRMLRYSPVMSDTPSSSPPSPRPADGPGRLRRRDRTFPVQHRDWLKLRQNVVNLTEPVPYLASVGWTCIGVTASALVALVAWLSINSALPSKAQMRYTFITPLLIITAAAGALIVAYTFTVWYQIKQIRITTVKNVLDEMDAVYEPYSHTDVSR